MLTHLAIRDYLLVERIELALEPGLTVLTGETGAGKSILVDALLLALGGRAEGGVVRRGAARAEVAAEFDLADLPDVRAWLVEAGLDGGEDSLLLRRVIDANGRSRAFINGSAVTVTQLREVGEALVDIHGQHAHHALLRPAVQRQVLDDFGGASALAAEVDAAWHAWQAAVERWRHAETHGRERQIEREGLGAALDELAAAGEDIARWGEIEAEHARLAHVTQLMAGSAALIDALDEGDAALGPVLHGIGGRLAELAGVDARLAETANLIAQAGALVDEAVHGLRRYADQLSIDPERLAELDRRMAEVHRLARKHRVRPEALADLAAELAARRDALAAADDVDALAAAERRAWTQYAERAEALSAQRRRAAAELAARVTQAMHELALADGAFRVQLVAASTPRAHGLEDVAFEVTSHHGLPFGPLARVASGGELSRISLGIQTALSGRVGVPTLIFDEVDVGIGGAVAEAVGRRLASLAATRQVLVITHLPQVAARGAHHLRVHKAVAGESVATQIAVLDPAARIEEVARMLGGERITATTRRHAAEMLAG
jgi:DNA repair protein RecN (Recombination protein N)